MRPRRCDDERRTTVDRCGGYDLGCGRHTTFALTGPSDLALRRLPYRSPYQRAFSKQRFHQVDGESRRLVPHVEGRIELDDVERSQAPRVGDHLPTKLRFGVSWAARHGGSHTGRDVRIEEVNIET